MEKINELLLKIKYRDGQKMNWDDIASRVGMSTETLRKVRFEGLYDSLRWGQVCKLAELLDMEVWEFVKIVSPDQ